MSGGLTPAGTDPDNPPFEITMQGLGLFACRRDAWPGFNPAFRGFGGEEGYIHEKIRQRGGETLVLAVSALDAPFQPADGLALSQSLGRPRFVIT